MNYFYMILICVVLSGSACENETQFLAGYEVYGVDISRHQAKINWDTVAKKGITFAFVKATEGKDLADKYYSDNWVQMKRVGIKRGAYLYFHASIPALDQFNNFKRTVQLEFGDLPPVIDVENDEDVEREELRKSLKSMIYLLHLQYNIKPIIYTHYKFYNKFIAGAFDDSPIWIARYGSNRPKLAAGTDWYFWQYGNRGKIAGIDGYVDFNVFRGSREDLDKISYGPGSLLSNLTK